MFFSIIAYTWGCLVGNNKWYEYIWHLIITFLGVASSIITIASIVAN